MPAKKVMKKPVTRISADAEIDRADLTEVRKILASVMCDILSGAITTKEGNAISRRAGKRLKAIEDELRSGNMAALGG